MLGSGSLTGRQAGRRGPELTQHSSAERPAHRGPRPPLGPGIQDRSLIRGAPCASTVRADVWFLRSTCLPPGRLGSISEKTSGMGLRRCLYPATSRQAGTQQPYGRGDLRARWGHRQRVGERRVRGPWAWCWHPQLQTGKAARGHHRTRPPPTPFRYKSTSF